MTINKDLYYNINEALKEFNDLKIADQIDFEKLYLYSIITHSTAIEGSTISEIENTLMFDEGIVPGGHTVIAQMMNLDLKKAYDYINSVISQKPIITVDFLKHLTSLIMKNTGMNYKTALGTFDTSAGDIRLVNVSAGRGGKSYMSYQKVPQKLIDFCEWLNNERQKNYSDAANTYALSFEAHYRLVSIHPWTDGNGRISRLIMNMIQMENGILPSILKKENKIEYEKSLAKSQEINDSSIFINFMMKSTLDYIENCITEYKNSIQGEKNELSIDGLHRAFERFEEKGNYGTSGEWKVEKDLSSSTSLWKLSYSEEPVALCVSKPEHDYITRVNEDIADKTFTQICEIAQSVFPCCKMDPEEQKQIQERKQSQK